MGLVQTGLLNGIAVIVKMLTLLGINKVLAIYVGPAGYASLGQFQNAVQMITVLASGAINTGVTKYTAEYQGNETKQHVVWRTAGSIALLGSIITGVTIMLFSRPLASLFLNNSTYGGVFVWFGAMLFFFTLNTLLLAILNGKKEIVRYVIANIGGSIFAFLVSIIMTIQFGLYGALVAMVIYQSITFFITMLLCRTASWFKFSHLFGSIDKQVAINLGKYAAMAVTSAVCVPTSHILVRDYLGETFGWAAAGYWEGSWRLSIAYLMLATTTLSVYYLPRLSELIKPIELKEEINYGYKIILPLAVLGGLSMYLLRDYIIELLFTPEFYTMRELFAWQIIGDVFKIGSWIPAYLLLGKAMFKTFMITEVIFSTSFVVLTILLTKEFGFQGVAIAHAINYFIYWIVIGIIAKCKLLSLM